MIIRNPSAYHGNKHKRPFFEGWYHKLTTKNNRSLAIIPGIYHSGKSNNKTAFIMVFDGVNGKVFFKRYKTSEFKCSKSKYALHLGTNYFSLKEIKLDIIDDDFQLKGQVYSNNILPV